MLRCKISPGIAMTNVRFGSKADIVGYQRDVRFPPKADITAAQMNVRFVPILLQKSATTGACWVSGLF
jgi:hypothetical protein